MLHRIVAAALVGLLAAPSALAGDFITGGSSTDKVQGRTLPGGVDPRTVVRASDLNDIKQHTSGWVNVGGSYGLTGAALASAAAAAVTANAGLLIAHPITISTAVGTVSVPIRFEGGGRLTLNTGGSVTLSGAMTAPLSAIFALGTAADFSGLTFSAKVPQVVPQWWGALGDGAHDDTGAVQTAFAAAGAPGTVLFPPGTYKTSAPLPLTSGLHVVGGSYGRGDGAPSSATIIVNGASSIFASSAATVSGVVMENFAAHSTVGGGHIIDLTGSGSVTNTEIRNVVLTQDNPAKAVVQATGSGGVFVFWMHHFSFSYAFANSVPALNFSNADATHIVLDSFYAYGLMGVEGAYTPGHTAREYAIRIDANAGTHPASNNVVREGVFETTTGGAVDFRGVYNGKIEGCRAWDFAYPTAPIFRVTASPGSGIKSEDVIIETTFSTQGSAAYPDLQIDGSVANGTSNATVIGSRFGWFDGVSTAGGYAPLFLSSYVGGTTNAAPLVIQNGAVTIPGALGISGAVTASGGATVPNGQKLTIAAGAKVDVLGSASIRSVNIAGSSATSLGLSVNAGTNGGTALVLVSNNTASGNATRSAMYLVRFGYDGDNFSSTFVSGTDFVTFSVVASTLTAAVTGGGNTMIGILHTKAQ